MSDDESIVDSDDSDEEESDSEDDIVEGGRRGAPLEIDDDNDAIDVDAMSIFARPEILREFGPILIYDVNSTREPRDMPKIGCVIVTSPVIVKVPVSTKKKLLKEINERGRIIAAHSNKGRLAFSSMRFDTSLLLDAIVAAGIERLNVGSFGDKMRVGTWFTKMFPHVLPDRRAKIDIGIEYATRGIPVYRILASEKEARAVDATVQATMYPILGALAGDQFGSVAIKVTNDKDHAVPIKAVKLYVELAHVA